MKSIKHREAMPGGVRQAKKLPWALNFLLFYLGAITIFGKGPTYLGLGPIYWGEIVLFLSLCWTLVNWNPRAFHTQQSRVLASLICLFIVFGATESIRDYPTWGMDTLRDSAVWYYSLFFFIGATIASRPEVASLFQSRWTLCFIVSIPWVAEEVITGGFLSQLSPILPGRGAPLLVTAMEVVVQSMGMGCLVLFLGNSKGKFRGSLQGTIMATIGLAVAAMAYTRSGRLSVLAAVAIIFATSIQGKSLGPMFRRRLAFAATLLALGGLIAITAGTNLYESLSFDRFEGVSIENPEGTAEWRQVWWTSLYDEVMEHEPVIGMGFGPNLADYNPLIQSQDDPFPVRSPHNFNVTIFSRMGILGALLWAAIIFWGLLIPLWGAIRQPPGDENEASVQRRVWIAFLFASWVNSSFSVLMEGPVLGIPFWLVLGIVAGSRQLNGYRVFYYTGSVQDSAKASEPRVVSSGQPSHAY